MHLTKQTDYAFRVLIYLASQDETQLSTIQAVCDVFDISKSHVMKVVQKLANHGYIDTVRGPNGGIKLGQVPNKINLRKIVELMETTLQPFNCEVPLCRINKSCALKHILNDAQTKYLEYIEGFSLEDLVSGSVRKDILIS
jgi:Rrf2 family nitric oxide-sensitive transcriptional repressor